MINLSLTRDKIKTIFRLLNNQRSVSRHTLQLMGPQSITSVNRTYDTHRTDGRNYEEVKNIQKVTKLIYRTRMQTPLYNNITVIVCLFQM